MKLLLTLVFSLLAHTGFAVRTYTVSKEDFVRQFADSAALAKRSRVACTAEDGKKVWLFFGEATMLTVQRANDKQRLIVPTVRYADGFVTGRAPDALGLPKTRHRIPLEEVVAFTIERRSGENEMPYANEDSACAVAQQKNDSLLLRCKADSSSIVIHLINRKDSSANRLTLAQEACYSLRFRDGQRAAMGVVQRLTPDSIYISSGFSPTTTVSNAGPYTILAYPIREIAYFELLKSGGYSKKKVMMEDHDVVVGKAAGDYCLVWYTAGTDGTVRLNRKVLHASGYFGVTEADGAVVYSSSVCP